MNRNQRPCPLCGNPMHRQSPRCHSCAMKDPVVRQHLSEAKIGKPSYERSDEWRNNASNRLSGHSPRGVGWHHSDETRQKMKDVWTQEKKEAKRQEMLLLNPDARYHGLSCKGAKRLRQSLSQCEKCGSDGSDSRLDVHHRNGNKKDQSLSNLTVLCHRCHMAVHAERQETGWSVYHRNKNHGS